LVFCIIVFINDLVRLAKSPYSLLAMLNNMVLVLLVVYGDLIIGKIAFYMDWRMVEYSIMNCFYNIEPYIAKQI
jgi:hypothetical protein